MRRCWHDHPGWPDQGGREASAKEKHHGHLTGPWYLDPRSGGPENDVTNRITTVMTDDLMHLAAMLRAADGVPAYGNERSEWDAGCTPDQGNSEHR